MAVFLLHSAPTVLEGTNKSIISVLVIFWPNDLSMTQRILLACDNKYWPPNVITIVHRLALCVVISGWFNVSFMYNVCNPLNQEWVCVFKYTRRNLICKFWIFWDYFQLLKWVFLPSNLRHQLLKTATSALVKPTIQEVLLSATLQDHPNLFPVVDYIWSTILVILAIIQCIVLLSLV